MNKLDLTPLDRLKNLLENIDFYLEADTRKSKRKYARSITRLTPAYVSVLRAMYSDLCKSGQSLTSWTAIKAVCEDCGLTVEPWDEVSWVVRTEAQSK